MQHVLQLAHIAGEGIAPQVAQGLGRQHGHGCDAGVLRDALQQCVADERDVFDARAQWRYGDLYDVEPVEEILAKAPGLHFGGEVLVRGAEHAHVDRTLLRRAQRTHHALLDHAQQLALHGHRQVANLVKKQRAALRRLKVAHAVFIRTREGALAIAEEFSFEKRLRDGTAVHRHEGLLAARRDFMDGARDELLARARLALHQHRRHAACHLLHQ